MAEIESWDADFRGAQHFPGPVGQLSPGTTSQFGGGWWTGEGGPSTGVNRLSVGVSCEPTAFGWGRSSSEGQSRDSRGLGCWPSTCSCVGHSLSLPAFCWSPPAPSPHTPKLGGQSQRGCLGVPQASAEAAASPFLPLSAHLYDPLLGVLGVLCRVEGEPEQRKPLALY